MLKKSKLLVFVSVVMSLLLLINGSTVLASAEVIPIENEEINLSEQIVMPDLGIDFSTVSKDEADKINKIANDMTEKVVLYNYITSLQNKTFNVRTNAIRTQALNEYLNFEKELISLGAVKLNDEQKLMYVLGTSEIKTEEIISTNASVGGVTYPDLSDITFYLYEYTISDSNGNRNYMIQCYAMPTPNTGGKMIIDSPGWVDYCNNLTIENFIKKTVIIIAEGLIDHILDKLEKEAQQISFFAGALWDLSGDVFPAKTSTYKGTKRLYISGSTIVVQYWHKVNGSYVFKLSTNAARIQEGWHVNDANGNQKFKTNEYWIRSEYYVEGADSLAIFLDSPMSFKVGNVSYKCDGKTILVVKPFYANYPIDFY